MCASTGDARKMTFDVTILFLPLWISRRLRDESRASPSSMLKAARSGSSVVEHNVSLSLHCSKISTPAAQSIRLHPHTVSI